MSTSLHFIHHPLLPYKTGTDNHLVKDNLFECVSLILILLLSPVVVDRKGNCICPFDNANEMIPAYITFIQVSNVEHEIL